MSNRDFTKINLWDETKKIEDSFALITEDGRIPSTRLEHWKDFTNLLESEFFNVKDHQYIFRGQRRSDWELTSSLGRLTSNGIVSQEVMDQQLQLFRRSIRGRVSDYALFESGIEDNELWSIGQHHGLMTPLLDWTYSPYVALFFAFSDEDVNTEKENEYRAVYYINKAFIDKFNEYEEILQLIEPKKDDFGRLVSQAGLFILSPSDAAIENKIIEALTSMVEEENNELDEIDLDNPAHIARYICKIYIKNHEQKACLKYLRKMNIHHASLFPDLLGSAQYCNMLMREQDARYISHDHVKTIKNLSEDPDLVDAMYEVNLDESMVENIYQLLGLCLSDYDDNKLKELSSVLTKELANRKTLNWLENASITDSMLAITRILLRKYDYPESLRQNVLDKILEVIKSF